MIFLNFNYGSLNLMSFYCDDDDEIINYESINNKINSLLEHVKIKSIDIYDLKVGDTVYINFTPNSQRYIYNLYPKYGKILSIDFNKIYDEIDNKYYENNIIKIINHDNIIDDLLHGGVSYYGQSLDYDYSLFLIVS